MAYIEAGITYRAIKRENTTALLEIVFNVRTPDNVPYFRLEINPEDEMIVLLEKILHEGQQSKEFQDFDPKVIAMMIRGTVSLSMSLPQNESIMSFKDYTEKVTKNVLKMIQ